MSIDRSTLEVKGREASGKGSARKLRVQGLVPAVIYGRALKAPQHISVQPAAIRKAINTPHKRNTLINIKVTGSGAAADHQVILKDFQLDPVSREILHADFLAVAENEQVKVLVPLVLTGKAQGVTDGGILSQARRDLEVWALPNAIPEKIDIDVSNLKIAEALHINDVKLPEGVTVKSHVNFTIAVVSVPEREEVVIAAAAVPAAGAAAPAGGAAPAAGAAAPAAAGAAKKDDKKK